MDNHLMIFESADFGRVRSVLKDGAPWFVAVDVCKALGLNQVTRAMSRLDSDEGGLLEVPHPQNADKTIEINAVSEARTLSFDPLFQKAGSESLQALDHP